jgi:hypothetical protein
LFDLLPGHFDDDLKINLYHSHLLKPVEHSQARLSVKELTNTLPPDWELHETLEGRYLFQQTSTGKTSWTHPKPEVQRELYEWWEGGQPSYEAVSYVWGSLETLATVYIENEDGVDVHGQIHIPPNLALLLRYVRYPNRPRTMWADSISINQMDLQERNSHVKRMADIYRYAYRTICWLGPASENSKLAITSLKQFAAQVDYTSGLQRVVAPNAKHPKWHLSANEIPFSQDTWQAILDLIRRDWFDRLWVSMSSQNLMQTMLLSSYFNILDLPRSSARESEIVCTVWTRPY